MPLTPKQAQFVDHYLACGLNGTEAAKRAGYSVKSAKRMAHRLLSNPEIQAAVADRQAKLAHKLGVTAEMIVEELRRIAFTDRRGICKLTGGKVEFKDFDSLTPDEASCIEEVSQTITDAGGTIRVRMGNKVEALKLLGQHLGMFIDRLDVGVSVTAKIVEEIVE